MNKKCYPFKLEPLPYAYNALEPQIDEKTMKLHHDKHLGKYVENLNNILSNNTIYQSYTLEELICNISLMPCNIRQDIRNNAGGVYNHNLYFKIMAPNKENSKPSSKLKILERITMEFGSFENFSKQFKECATKLFGSGYTWLVICKNERKLKIINTSNQDCVIEKGYFPLFLIDVWEHAYYLKYNNRRNEYIDNFMQIINFEYVNKRYCDFLMNNKM